MDSKNALRLSQEALVACGGRASGLSRVWDLSGTPLLHSNNHSCVGTESKITQNNRRKMIRAQAPLQGLAEVCILGTLCEEVSL